MTQKPKRISPKRTEYVDERLYIYLHYQEEPVILNASAAFVWNLCDGEKDLDTITRLIQGEYGMPPEVAQEMMMRTLYRLGRADLLAEPLADQPQLYTRRQFLKILATLGISAFIAPQVSTVAQAADIIDTIEYSTGPGGGPGIIITTTTPPQPTTTTTSTTTTNTTTNPTPTTTRPTTPLPYETYLPIVVVD